MNIQYRPEGLPEAHGLYDPRNEHDACGIGLIANIHNVKSHRMVADGLSILKNLEHRGAVGADPKAGDGAGLMLQIPHAFFLEESKRLGFELPAQLIGGHAQGAGGVDGGGGKGVGRGRLATAGSGGEREGSEVGEHWHAPAALPAADTDATQDTP